MKCWRDVRRSARSHHRVVSAATAAGSPALTDLGCSASPSLTSTLLKPKAQLKANSSKRSASGNISSSQAASAAHSVVYSSVSTPSYKKGCEGCHHFSLSLKYLPANKRRCLCLFHCLHSCKFFEQISSGDKNIYLAKSFFQTRSIPTLPHTALG